MSTRYACKKNQVKKLQDFLAVVEPNAVVTEEIRGGACVGVLLDMKPVAPKYEYLQKERTSRADAMLIGYLNGLDDAAA